MKDASASVAQEEFEKWVESKYGPYVNMDNVIRFGEGDEELYGFTFPSLQELAEVKANVYYPVKIGWTGDRRGTTGRIGRMLNSRRGEEVASDALKVERGPGASVVLSLASIESIAARMGKSHHIERAGFPEKAKLLIVCRTSDARELEAKVHGVLRGKGRKVDEAVGNEWFRTNVQELTDICRLMVKELESDGE
jgi:hypothetical protein